MKGRCKICGREAFIKLHYPRMYLCREHFIEYFERKVQRTIDRYHLLKRDDWVLVAVSGGKDSAVTAWVLNRLGYNVECLHIDLGIGDYSKRSREYAERQCRELGLKLHVLDVRKLVGHGIGEVRTRRPVCSYCGLTKRYLMNKFAYDNGFDVIATGHNLDDEASFIFSSLMNWNVQYLAKQGPKLEGKGKMVGKVKPLYELTEREIALYAVASGIDYLVDECPHSRGAVTLRYKAVLNGMEEERPGTKLNFVKGYLRNRELFERKLEEMELRECRVCGMPSSGEVCSFCRFWGLEKPLDLRVRTRVEEGERGEKEIG
ncbi:MAG: TIGR00269 family protein [Thermococci archaeon]|nr:TIGR00269 family protein [Thermococci archaeon]